MPIAPKPYKLKCTKCGYTKIVKIKSDALDGKDILAMSTICPKCQGAMHRIEMNFLEKTLLG